MEKRSDSTKSQIALLKKSSSLPNYLRMHRRRAGLTQADMAYLLGTQSSGRVSRYERFARRPALETAMAFEIILGVPVGDLFAGVREDVEYEVKKRARRLRRRLTQRQANRRPLAAVAAVLDRSNEDVSYEPVP
jgi:transcriptional regulator with XRE-family HTH domain